MHVVYLKILVQVSVPLKIPDICHSFMLQIGKLEGTRVNFFVLSEKVNTHD